MNIFNIFKKKGLSTENRLMIGKLMSIVAWADGNLDESEKKELKLRLADIGGLHDDQIDEVLEKYKELTADLILELKSSGPVIAHTIMKNVFRVAMADNMLKPSEEKILEKIASEILPDKEWSLVKNWMITYNDYINATKVLFK
jgi:uncharacterized tellurite resistance protein B-like protein